MNRVDHCTSNALLTQRVTRSDELPEILGRWIKKAGQKSHLESLTPDDKERLLDCSTVCRNILPNIIDIPENAELYTARDSKGRLQGVMFIALNPTLPHLSIVDIASNPDNLIPANAKQDSDPDPVRGAGISLISQAVARTHELSKDCIYIQTAYRLAIPFYEKRGFTVVKSGGTSSSMMLLTGAVKR